MPDRFSQQRPVGDMTGRIAHKMWAAAQDQKRKNELRRQAEAIADALEQMSAPELPQAIPNYDPSEVVDYTKAGGYQGSVPTY